MKLIFKKEEDKDINLTLTNGTIVEDFSYTAMVKQLLTNVPLEESDFINISSEEQLRINAMLQKINEAVITDHTEEAV